MTADEQRELSHLWDEYGPDQSEMCNLPGLQRNQEHKGCGCQGCEDHPRFRELMEKMFEFTYHASD